jgi:methionyl-tRNA formyltransferase
MEPIIFAGTPQNAALTLRELVAGGQAVALVLTRQDAPVGRKRLMTESPVAEAATQLGIPVLKTNSISAEDEEAIANSGAIDDILKTGAPIVYDNSALIAIVQADSTSTGLPNLTLEISNG